VGRGQFPAEPRRLGPKVRSSFAAANDRCDRSSRSEVHKSDNGLRVDLRDATESNHLPPAKTFRPDHFQRLGFRKAREPISGERAPEKSRRAEDPFRREGRETCLRKC
jgi:hypothetical protein